MKALRHIKYKFYKYRFKYKLVCNFDATYT